MSIEKSELKILISNNIGSLLEDQRDTAQASIHSLDGARIALSSSLQNIDQLKQHINKDLEEGTIGELTSNDEVSDYVKRYIDRCIGAIRNQLQGIEVAKLKTVGSLEAYQKSMKIIEKEIEDEKAKMKAVELFESGDSDSKPDGVHPGDSLKEQRKEEE